jgi:hypothetical protein
LKNATDLPCLPQTIGMNHFEQRFSTTVGILRRIAIRFAYAENLFSRDEANRPIKVFRMTLLEMLVIDLAKFFDDRPNQKHNIFLLLKHLADGTFGHQRVNNSQAEEWAKEFSKFESTFKDNKKLRDELVAHADYYGSFEPTDGYFPKIRLLINRAFDILDSCSLITRHERVGNTLSDINIAELTISEV